MYQQLESFQCRINCRRISSRRLRRWSYYR
nr:MAG TPA: hypothetical protein [Caudoviricetes sp.]DAX10785.1 MAG TPA: hypothetical protein [Bacteriophage sp.]